MHWQIAPRFSLIDISNDAMIIRDDSAKKTRLAMINIRNGKMWCELDEVEDCNHIHYALMLPELSKLKNILKHV